MRIRRLIATVVATAATVCAFAAPATAQNQQQGLVNVAIEDTAIQVPVAVAANICDVNVAVLAELVDEARTCTATADSAATAGPTDNDGDTQQEGLINVLVDNVVVQVPVAIAANVCDVNVAILATVVDDARACVADADAAASRGPGQNGGANQESPPVVLIADSDADRRLDNDPLTTTGLPL